MNKRIIRRKPLAAPLDDSLVARLFAARGITDTKQLELDLDGLLPPDSLKNLSLAAELLVDHIRSGNRILIVGDFDADGATSCALMMKGLTALGAKHVSYLVPDRFKFGYGLTPEIVEVAAQRSPDLIITVDNGIASVEGVAEANRINIPVLITDHHLPGNVLPDAAAIVNPNQPGCGFASKSLAGVGVAFYVLIGLRMLLRQLGWFESHPEPNLANLLDLVALGTVADLVPMDQNNRRLVAAGLRRIRSSQCSPGIRSLLQIAGVDNKVATTRDLGFFVAPRLNAAGRLEDMSIGIECLLSDDQEAPACAARLDELNAERKAIESDMRTQAMQNLESLTIEDNKLAGICIYDRAWHQGVVGIIASRVKEKTYRPVIAFARGEEGELKGSGRSIPDFHMRDALDLVATRHPHLLSRFGGHAMAAGLSLKEHQLPAFERAFDDVVREQLGEAQVEQVVETDGELGEPITLELAQTLATAAPWGQGFPEPEFDDEFEIVSQRLLSGQHLKMILQPNLGPSVDAICFNQSTTIEGRFVRCAYRVDVNRYRDRESVQLIVSLIKPRENKL
ncbi:MAG: single-stranded-DNA-specific exonuclease RecJ [Pseudomonadota bacterium]